MYDPLDRPASVSYSDGRTPHVAYTYTPTGLRQSMTDGTGTTSYQYDALERTVAVTNGAGQAVAYAYNPVGDTAAITYPGGVAVARTYDPLDRVTALRDWLGQTSTFGYDPAGNPISETLPNTTGVAWAYNAADALTAITRTTPTTAPRVYAYGRDGLGQVTSATDSADPTARGYRYSALNQLQGDTGGITYTASSAYDLQSITTTVAGANTSSVFGYDPAHELTSLQTLSGTTPTRALTLSYNGDGDRVAVTNTVSGAVTGYRYDQADRLIGVTGGVTTSAYSYDGDGLRQGKTVTGVATSYTWDTTQGLPTLLQEQTGAATTRYIYGPDGLPLAQVDASGNALYSYRDQLGSTRELGDGGGRIVAAARYDAYGNLLAKTGTASTPFGYAGAYTDGETGLQYLQARYYDPATAQFLTRDPLASATGQPYAYTGNNPLNATDPSGQLCVFGVHVPGTLNDCPGSGPSSAPDPPADSKDLACMGGGFLRDPFGCGVHRGTRHGCAGFQVQGPIDGLACAGLNGLRRLNVLLHGNPDAAGPVVGNLYKAAEAVQSNQAVNNIVDPFACAAEPIVATAANAATYALGIVDPTELAEALAYREAVSGAEQLALAQARRESFIAAQDAASAADRDAASQIQQQGDFFSGQYQQQAHQQQMQTAGRQQGPVYGRYVNAEEADASLQAGSNGGLVPRPGHESQPKRIFDSSADIDVANLGKTVNYTHRLTIYTKTGTQELVGKYPIEGEPGRYAIPADVLDEFNSNVTGITSQLIRRPGRQMGPNRR